MAKRDVGKTLADRALMVWQSRYEHTLSSEDAREITENTTGFFLVLAQWASREDGHIQHEESLTLKGEKAT